MIGMLRGLVDAVGTEEVVIDVNGVGYLVSAGAQTLARLEVGAEVKLHIETHVREDAFKLFGFLDETERAWFVHLGVGAKAAFAILDAVPVTEIANAIALGDKSTFGRAKGVGPKLATRIATELKDKAPPAGRSLGLGLPVHASAPSASTETSAASNDEAAVREEAVSALLNLGYAETVARQAVATIQRSGGEGLALGEVIRQSLKELAP